MQPKPQRSFRNDQRGAVAILVALSLPVLLGFASLAVEVGYARQYKAQAQNAADFAALAGAGVLKGGTAAHAGMAALDYAEKNGFTGTDAEVDIPPAAGAWEGKDGCVQVVTRGGRTAVLGSLFGIDVFDVSAKATACATPPLGGRYAVFAGSTTCSEALSFSGANRTINGGVHSNNDMKITGAGTTINGDATLLNGSIPSGNIVFNPATDNPRRLDETLNYPEVFGIADYAPGGSKALLAMSQLRYHYAGNADINVTWLTLNLAYNPLTKTIAPGLYYTSGNIDLSGNDYNAAGATFVTSSGDIHFNGNNFAFTAWDPDGLLLFSNKNQPSCNPGQAVLKLNGNNHSWRGIMFAPRGPLDFSGTNIEASLNGRLVAQTVKLSGSSQTITRADTFPGKPGGFELVE